MDQRTATAVRLVTVAVAGFLYGFLTAHIPSPRGDGTIFWVSNLAAPYLLLAFLAGAWRFQVLVGSAAGALATGAAIAGFYNIVAARDHLGRWISTFILGQPGGRPWLTIAVIIGLIFGHLGYRWHQRGSRYAGACWPWHSSSNPSFT